MKREAFKFWYLVRLILETLRYFSSLGTSVVCVLVGRGGRELWILLAWHNLLTNGQFADTLTLCSCDVTALITDPFSSIWGRIRRSRYRWRCKAHQITPHLRWGIGHRRPLDRVAVAYSHTGKRQEVMFLFVNDGVRIGIIVLEQKIEMDCAACEPGNKDEDPERCTPPAVRSVHVRNATKRSGLCESAADVH